MERWHIVTEVEVIGAEEGILLEEQQRRENAAKAGSGTLSGGRTRSFKYEDDIERSLAKASRRR